MEWWQTLLMTAGSCLVTLVVTFLFNWFTNGPKRLKERRRKEMDGFKAEVKKAVDDVRAEALRQNDDCRNDHICLAKIVGDIQLTNKAQSEGLLALLRDILKTQYVECLNQGFASVETRDDLEHAYHAYHLLGGNSTITTLRDRFLALPLEPKHNNG